jgi:hypothetical protein
MKRYLHLLTPPQGHEWVYQLGYRNYAVPIGQQESVVLRGQTLVFTEATADFPPGSTVHVAQDLEGNFYGRTALEMAHQEFLVDMSAAAAITAQNKFNPGGNAPG